jgi:hypothetical protein
MAPEGERPQRDSGFEERAAGVELRQRLLASPGGEPGGALVGEESALPSIH